jgi:TolB-like protein
MFLALALAAPTGWAASDQVSGKSVCVFPLVNLTTRAAQQDYQKPLSEAVQQEFDAAGFSIVPRDRWEAQAAQMSLKPEGIREASQALRLARSVGVDMAVAGFYQMDKDRLLVSVQCYDVAAGTLITGFSHTWRFNLGFYNNLHSEIADLVQRVIFTTAPRLIDLKDSVRVNEITFTSPQNGMEVVLEGEKSVGTIQNGTLVFQTGGVKAGTPLRVEKRKDGYHTVWQTVPAAPQIALVPLPRRDTLSFEANWTLGQLEGAGGGIRWYPIPNWLFAGFEEYLSMQIPTITGASLPIHADSDLVVGLYLFYPPQAGFRLGVSAGAGAILTWIPGTSLPLFTDVYINLLNLWFEWRVGDYLLFSRIELKMPLGIGNSLLPTGNGPIHWGPFLPPIAFGVVIPWR